MAELLVYLVPKKYNGHLALGSGILFIMLSTLFLSAIQFGYMNILNILGQICLIIGIFGIYYRKKRSFGSVRKSEEKEGIEQKSLNGIEGKDLHQKNTYIFYVIIIVGIGFITLFTINYLIFINTKEWLGGVRGFFSPYGAYLFILYFGDLFLIFGLRIIYVKKKKAYKLEKIKDKSMFSRV